MSYDTTKLTNLGQMKSALQRLNYEVTAAKSVRLSLAIAKSNWTTYEDIKRYSTGVSATTYHYYDLHLDPSSSATVSANCANADIRARIENSIIYLYAYNYPAAGLDNFNLELIVTPTTSNEIGLTYNIGDDYLVCQSDISSLSTRVSTLENTTIPGINSRLQTQEGKMSTLENTTIPGLDSRIQALESLGSATMFQANDISVATSKWVASTASDANVYKWKAVLTVKKDNVACITSNYFAVVQISDTDQSLYEFKPVAVTGDGTVTIFCKGDKTNSYAKPSTTVTISSLLCYLGTTVTVE